MKMRRFEIKNNSKCIKGCVYENDTNSEYPVIILSHEFGLNMLSTMRYAKRLRKLGYTVYIFDFPGSGAGCSKGLSSTQMSVQTQKQDLSMVLDYVQNRHAGKIVLAGASQGGMVTALLAAERAEEIDKAILIYPALCIPDDARRGCVLCKKIDPENIPDQFTTIGYVRLGRKYVEDAQQLDPWQEICSFEKPVLILHGNRDSLVPVSYSQKASEKYARAYLHIYPGAEHLFPRRKDVNRAVTDMDAFLRGYEEALCIDVKIRKLKFQKMKLLIAFCGDSIGQHYKGSILDGAVDTWVFRGLRCISKRAEYTLDTDNGKVYIVNADTGSGWSPTVITECAMDYDFSDCYAIVKQRFRGPLVRIYARKVNPLALNGEPP